MSSFFLQKLTCRTALLRHLTLPTCKELKFFKCLKCDPPKMYNQRASLYEHLKTYHKIKGLTTIRGCTEEAMGCWRCGLKMPLCDLEDHLQEHEDNDPELEILGSDLDPPAYSKQERHTPKKSQEMVSEREGSEEEATREPPKKRKRVRAGPSPPPSTTEDDSQSALPGKQFTTKKPSRKDRRKKFPHWSTTPSPSSSPNPPLPSMEQEEDEAQKQEVDRIKRALLLHETTEEEAVSTRSTRSVTRAAAVEQKGKGKGAGKKTKK